MHTVLLVIGSAAAGGLTTSLFEFFLKYNLVDLVVDKVKALLGVAKADIKAEVNKL